MLATASMRSLRIHYQVRGSLWVAAEKHGIYLQVAVSARRIHYFCQLTLRLETSLAARQLQSNHPHTLLPFTFAMTGRVETFAPYINITEPGYDSVTKPPPSHKTGHLENRVSYGI